MQTISKRILHYMNEKNVSYSQLSKLTGITKSSLQRYATGATNKIPIDAITRIEDALRLKKGTLMGWIDDAEITKQIELTSDEYMIISKYRKLNADGKQKADEYITDLSEQAKYTAITSGNIADDIVKEIQRAAALDAKHTNKR